MASVNKVIIIGNLGKDPEMRSTNTGKQIANFSVATTERYSNSNGQHQETTEWHNVVAWNRTAENCGRFLRKGSSVYIEGKIKTETWDNQGVTQYKKVIVANNVTFLSGDPSKKEQQEYSGDELPF